MLARRIHVSWFLAWFFLCAIIGILLSKYLADYFDAASWLIGGTCLLAIAVISRRQFMIILAVIAGLIVGLSRGSISQVDLRSYQPFIKTDVVVQGTVSEDVAFSQGGNQRIKLKNIILNDNDLPGEIWVSTASQESIKRSDMVEASGTLSEGFGTFSGAMYRAKILKIERVDNSDIARDIRDSFASSIRKNVSEPEASLGIGYLVGQRTALPEDLSEQLRILGLTHIIVASGYNLTILVRFARRLFARVSKYLSLLVGFFLTFSFILITGLSPSMTRAGLITCLSLVAWYFGRSIHPLVLLPVAAGITALVNPAYVWGDLGWYLSFAAFGGVIILSPLLISYFWGKNKPNSLLQILTETVSAQIVAMPIVALAFSQFAPLAVISNLLILPLVPLAMIFTFLAGISGALFGATAFFGFPAQAVLTYMTSVVGRLSEFPVAVSEVYVTPVAIVGFYLLIILFCVFLYRRTRHDFHKDNIVE